MDVKMPLKLIRIKLLKNELKCLQEPPDVDSLNGSELLSLHKEVVGKPAESITMAKNNLELLSRNVIFKCGMITPQLQIMVILW